MWTDVKDLGDCYSKMCPKFTDICRENSRKIISKFIQPGIEPALTMVLPFDYNILALINNILHFQQVFFSDEV